MKIDEIISNSIADWKRTRSNRLSAHKRLSKYNNQWGFLSFCFNVISAILLLMAFFKGSPAFTVLATFYSMYVLILQMFIYGKSYESRALKLHYEQLELNDLRTELKLLLSSPLQYDEKVHEYQKIFEKYQMSLKNNENHSDFDDDSNRVIDLSFDNVFFYINVIIVFIVVVMGIYLWN